MDRKASEQVQDLLKIIEDLQKRLNSQTPKTRDTEVRDLTGK